jgi:trehalose 6-phosphate phosphatase
MIPHASSIVRHVAAARGTAGHLLLGLDFDGTIAPIVPRPEDAALLPDAGAVLRSLARRADTWIAILSGRALADIARRVPLDGAFYAGNHGLEITGPGVHRVHERAADSLALMAEISRRLQHDLAGVAGAQLEDKGLTLSVHYRRAPDDRSARQAREIVEQMCAPYEQLRVTHGKKIVEVRPAVDWDKGEALRFLRDTIDGGEPAAPTVFIGDDRTDEDAFAQVGPRGHGIIVADPVPTATAAHAYLRSPAEVVEFLRGLDGS